MVESILYHWRILSKMMIALHHLYWFGDFIHKQFMNWFARNFAMMIYN